MDTTCSPTRQFEKSNGKKSKIIGSFLEFVHIVYITKRYNFKKKRTDKTFKAIMVGYSENHMRAMYKLYNHETKRVIMTRDAK